MKVKVLGFGIIKEYFGSDSVIIDIDTKPDTEHLRTILETRFPRLKILESYMIAVNEEYARGSSVLNEGDEVAIIPPVSGG